MKKFISFLMCVVLAATPVYASDTENDNGIFGLFGGALDAVTSAANEAEKATKGAINAAGDTLNEFGAMASDTAGKAVSDLGGFIGGLGQNIAGVADQLSDAAASVSNTVAKQSEEIAERALTAFNGAANVVVDEAGNVVNMATEGAGAISAAAKQALDTIASHGTELMTMADEAVADLDLSDPENIEKAWIAIDEAFDEAYNQGLIGNTLSLDAIRIIKDIVFATTVYGYQYAHGVITLSEYSALMSEVIIKDGLPVGVGYIADLLPIPGAGYIAKKVVTFLVQAAYGKGEEEVLYEDTKQEGAR